LEGCSVRFEEAYASSRRLRGAVEENDACGKGRIAESTISDLREEEPIQGAHLQSIKADAIVQGAHVWVLEE
jgi:hypothetical protein